MHKVEIEVAGEWMVLHPFRALFWPRMKWLVVSDLHLGKAAHFRKAGMPLPEGSDARTLERLQGLVQEFDPARLVIIGDLFHSIHNHQWSAFVAWCRGCGAEVHLVKGNHDALTDPHYADAGLAVHAVELREGPFVFLHEPAEVEGAYVLAGHVHPGVVLHGTGRDSVRLPCFHFGQRCAVLPAFGLATGLYTVRPAVGDRVLAITDRAVVPVPVAERTVVPKRKR